MTDKERILMCIVTRIIPAVDLYNSYRNDSNGDNWAIKGNLFRQEELKNGDLVYACTPRTPNDWMVGFVDHVDKERDCVVIREIGTDRLCDYSNESFTLINKERLGYEILEGVQYKIYNKSLKAFSDYVGYCTRFHSIKFDGDKCFLSARTMFQSDIDWTVEFEYSSKTTIKSIGKLLEEKENGKKEK